MAKRNKGLNTAREDFIRTIARRVDKKADSKTLEALSQRIHSRTSKINEQYRQREKEIIAQFDALLDAYANSPEAARNISIAKQNYMSTHMDDEVKLKDLSGKVRTTREAKEILRRLINHDIAESDKRFKKNYIDALHRQGYDDLAEFIDDMPLDKFLISYYMNPNADQAFDPSPPVRQETTLEFRTGVIMDAYAFQESWSMAASLATQGEYKYYPSEYVTG